MNESYQRYLLCSQTVLPYLVGFIISTHNVVILQEYTPSLPSRGLNRPRIEAVATFCLHKNRKKSTSS